MGPKKRSLLLWFNALFEPLELFKLDKMLELLELLEGTDNDGVTREGPLEALLKLELFKLLFISPLLSGSGIVGPGIFCLFTMHLFTLTTTPLLLALGNSVTLSKLAFGGGVAPFCPSFCNRFTSKGLDIAIFPPDDADGLLGGLLTLTPGEVTYGGGGVTNCEAVVRPMVFSRRWITRACVILSNGYSQLSTAFGTICAGSFPSSGQIVLGDLKTPLLELFELLKLLGPLGPLWCCCWASLDEGVVCVTVALADAELVEGLSAADVPEVEA